MISFDSIMESISRWNEVDPFVPEDERRCATCKWWKPAPRFDTSRQWGPCQYSVGHNKLIWSAEDIMTHATFGCVQWEAREEEQVETFKQAVSAAANENPVFLEYRIDPNMPPGELRLEEKDGTIVGRIVETGTE